MGQTGLPRYAIKDESEPLLSQLHYRVDLFSVYGDGDERGRGG